MHETAHLNHTPKRSIRMGDPAWNGLGAQYGARQRSAILAQCVAYLLREPGAKLPERAPRPSSG